MVSAFGSRLVFRTLQQQPSGVTRVSGGAVWLGWRHAPIVRCDRNALVPRPPSALSPFRFIAAPLSLTDKGGPFLIVGAAFDFDPDFTTLGFGAQMQVKHVVGAEHTSVFGSHVLNVVEALSPS